MKRKLWIGFLCVALLCLVVYGACAATSGSCGENLAFSVEGSKLIISGTGAMDDYALDSTYGTTAPWADIASNLTTVEIQEGVTTIGRFAFCKISSLTDVTLPDSVTRIGNNAFYYCNGLANISFSSGLTVIDTNAFYNCTGLTELTFPAGLTRIGNLAFLGCSGLTKITFLSGVQTIEFQAFQDCTRLSEVSLPYGTETIGDNAFRDCSNLSRIFLPSSLKTVGVRVFTNCANPADLFFDGTETQWNNINKDESWNEHAEYISIHLRCTVIFDANGHGTAPEPVEAWTNSVIANPGDLTADGWTFTGWYKEAACENKWDFDTEIVPRDMTLYAGWEEVPASTDPPASDPPAATPTPGPGEPYTAPDGSRYTVNGDGADFLTPDTSDSDVTIPDTITVNGAAVPVTGITDNAFSGNSKVTTVTIGKNVKTIGKKAFYNCKNLKTVKGGQGVVTIKDSAFASDANLKTIPAFPKLQTLGDSAFKGCKALAKVTLGKNVKKIGKSAFEGCKKLKTITIQTAKLKKNSIGKNSFKGIYAKPTVKCPKKQREDYKTWLRKVGKMPSKAKFK